MECIRYSFWNIIEDNYTLPILQKAVSVSHMETVSLDLQRGSTVKYKKQLAYIGGSSKGKIAIHDIETGKRVNQNGKRIDIVLLCVRKYTTTYNKRSAVIPSAKSQGYPCDKMMKRHRLEHKDTANPIYRKLHH